MKEDKNNNVVLNNEECDYLIRADYIIRHIANSSNSNVIGLINNKVIISIDLTIKNIYKNIQKILDK